MAKWYFTYGTDEDLPFYGGWSVIHADTWAEARRKHITKHGTDEGGYARFAFQYSEEEWVTGRMAEVGNLGYFAHEVIGDDEVEAGKSYLELKKEIIDNLAEEVAHEPPIPYSPYDEAFFRNMHNYLKNLSYGLRCEIENKKIDME